MLTCWCVALSVGRGGAACPACPQCAPADHAQRPRERGATPGTAQQPCSPETTCLWPCRRHALAAPDGNRPGHRQCGLLGFIDRACAYVGLSSSNAPAWQMPDCVNLQPGRGNVQLQAKSPWKFQPAEASTKGVGLPDV